MEKAPDVAEAVETFYRAFQEREPALIDQVMSKEVLVIGTDPDEWLEGEDAIAAIRRQVEGAGGGVTIESGEVSAYKVGDVGWFAARGAFVLGEKRVPIRHSGVTAREGDAWKIVQEHVSIGVPDAEALGGS